MAKQFGVAGSGKQVAYLWAKSLGGDSAIKLLQKLNLLEECIDYAVDTTYVLFVSFNFHTLALLAHFFTIHVVFIC